MIVLGFLVLLTVLIVAFYTTVSTDFTSSQVYSSGAATRQLADSAVQVVMGQIKAATTGTNQTWASQPGMIRSYDASGNSARNYKLYSSDAMTTTGTFTPVAGKDFNTSAAGQPALWTDLNAPVMDATGTENFPIIDGNGLKTLTVDGTGKTVTPYLGYDALDNTSFAAGADGKPDIQGFGVEPSQVAYNPANALSATNNPVPVPVRWMYQLSDGTLIVPDVVAAGVSTRTATFANAAVQPSTSNPIVGRIAFWTDDETSKVNINTAGQGTFWDTPHFTSQVLSTGTGTGGVTAANASQFPDYAYAAFQPGLFEFQRYPGHPSLVALNTIFPGMTWATAVGVTPRLSDVASGGALAGSQGGTAYPTNNINPALAPRRALYASVDEFLYSPATGISRTVNNVNNSSQSLTKAQMENAKFFLTSESRAPEVNLFGKPRVAMWPIHSNLASNPNSPYTTAYDRLIAFCASLHNTPVGGAAATPYRYFFQRNNSQSATADYSGIADNQRLYNYLLGLMQQSVPGFGNSFASKYAADTPQILTEIFDYIRCTNLSDPNLNPDPMNPGGSTMSSLANWAKAPYVFANCLSE